MFNSDWVKSIPIDKASICFAVFNRFFINIGKHCKTFWTCYSKNPPLGISLKGDCSKIPPSTLLVIALCSNIKFCTASHLLVVKKHTILASLLFFYLTYHTQVLKLARLLAVHWCDDYAPSAGSEHGMGCVCSTNTISTMTWGNNFMLSNLNPDSSSCLR